MKKCTIGDVSRLWRLCQQSGGTWEHLPDEVGPGYVAHARCGRSVRMDETRARGRTYYVLRLVEPGAAAWPLVSHREACAIFDPFLGGSRHG